MDSFYEELLAQGLMDPALIPDQTVAGYVQEPLWAIAEPPMAEFTPDVEDDNNFISLV